MPGQRASFTLLLVLFLAARVVDGASPPGPTTPPFLIPAPPAPASSAVSNFNQAQIQILMAQVTALRVAAKSLAGHTLLPLTWSPGLANYAQDWVNQQLKAYCSKRIVPSRDYGGEYQYRSDLIYGEINYMGDSYTVADAQGYIDAFNYWSSTKNDWDKKTCSDARFNCNEYTQLVWEMTRFMGCGQGSCSNGGSLYLSVCYFDPPGDIDGEKPFLPAIAPPPPYKTVSPYSPQERKELVDAHNYYRSLEYAGNKLAWNGTLATPGQKWANFLLKVTCNVTSFDNLFPAFYHTPNNTYGENIYWNWWNSFNPDTLTSVVDTWAAEKQWYHYNSNTCDPGKECGHYTQVVWKTTKQVGCGEASCVMKNFRDFTLRIVVCEYSPPGNLVGQKPF